MKRVTFEIAKALETVGYPQGEADNTRIPKYYGANGKFVKLPLVGDQVVYFAPTYIDVWLWLWRVKHIPVKANYSFANDNWFASRICDKKFNDPEEVIVAAIEYLVENNLIK